MILSARGGACSGYGVLKMKEMFFHTLILYYFYCSVKHLPFQKGVFNG